MDHHISLNLHYNQEKDIKARINYILNVSIQMINPSHVKQLIENIKIK